jgi:YVTN family beta-propeller protein
MNSTIPTGPRLIKVFSFFFVSISLFITADQLTPAQAESSPAMPSSGLINPRAIAFNPATGKVYAVDTAHGAVQIYNNATSQRHSVKVGKEPVSLAVNTQTGRVYIANAGDGTVTVLDGTSDAVVATIPTGAHPYSIAANSASGKVYVTHTFGDQLSIVDGATNTLSELKIGSADLIAVNSIKNKVYLLGYGTALTELDGETLAFAQTNLGKHAWALTIDEATDTPFVALIEDAAVAEWDRSSSKSSTFATGKIPCAIAVKPSANTLYVANFQDNTVSIVDRKNRTPIATVAVGKGPKAIAYDAKLNRIYVANTLANTVSVIDATRNTVMATLPAGSHPYAIAVIPGSKHLYLANESDVQASTLVDLSAIHESTSSFSASNPKK